MTKKQSMPDFTSAFTSSLSADLKEAAAKMRRMSQPPKHPSQPEEGIKKETAPVSNQSHSAAPQQDLTPPESITDVTPSPADDKTPPSQPGAKEETEAYTAHKVTVRHLPYTEEQEEASSARPHTPERSSLDSGLSTTPAPSADSIADTLLPIAPLPTETATNSHEQSLTVDATADTKSDKQSQTVINSKYTSHQDRQAPSRDKEDYPEQPSTVTDSCRKKQGERFSAGSSNKEHTPTVNPESSFDSHKLSSTDTAPEQQKAVDVKQREKPKGDTSRPSLASATLQEAHIGGARQIILDALHELQQHTPRIIVNLKRLAPALGLSYGTVRNTVSRLVHEGVICTTQVRTGDVHGVCIEFIDDYQLPSMTVISHATQTPQLSLQQSPTEHDRHQQSFSKKTIWDSDEDLIAILWPHAAKAGFKPLHLSELHQAYHVQGWEADNVARCLRYLDWELSHGRPSPAAHVTTWLRTMQRQGHYPRPEGYVDPEVMRLRQQAEEEQALADAKAALK